MTYTANGNQVFANGVLFLTVHPDSGSTRPVEELAMMIAALLEVTCGAAAQ